MVQPIGYKTGKTYKENPKLNEFIKGFAWKYTNRELTPSDKSPIETILKHKSEE